MKSVRYNGEIQSENSQLKRQVRLNKPNEKELNSTSRPSRCALKAAADARAVPETAFASSMVALGREAGRWSKTSQ